MLLFCVHNLIISVHAGKGSRHNGLLLSVLKVECLFITGNSWSEGPGFQHMRGPLQLLKGSASSLHLGKERVVLCIA